ncbi:hypothetical protein [Janthinobacterium psychrotolerans]|uniref:Uncharacterized protein n=1 Tax=Janthinobacterium psychrotolerans TaxID=1747903 RepID=A0A1A7C0W2_9BURK|nr:hypothetical protein [Janthinobacterium psychrotolerans]OBV37943.1 hypothetical protein ASR47_1004218 [Janthinobacterium psychrotolerans]
MTPAVAHAIVEARLLGEHAIPVKIRTTEPVTEDEIAELLAAVDFLIAHYQDQPSVPKTLAAAFVDIYSGFVPGEGTVTASCAQRLEEVAIALQDKAYRLFLP